MPYLDFISDEDLFNHVKTTLNIYKSSINLDDFEKNLVDPIKLTFDKMVYNKPIEEIIFTEVLRQIDKSNNNQIGYFHQNIFKYINNDYSIPSLGFDLVNEKNHVFVEIKNKHNTMNSSSSQKTYMKMQGKILRDSKATCYLLEIIAKKSQDTPWKISLDNERIENERIRKISADKFYELITGDSLAFYKLCKVLPTVITDVLKDSNNIIFKESVLDEIKEKSSLQNIDILTYIFKNTFSTYEGF